MSAIKEIYAICGDKSEKFNCSNGIYSCGDTQLNIGDDGSICVTSQYEAPQKIRLVFSQTFTEGTLFLGDALERGYGDLCWKEKDVERIMPWYFVAHKNGMTWGFGVKTGASGLCYWNVKENTVELTVDIRNGTNSVQLCGRTLKAATLVFYEKATDAFDGACEFCSLMCQRPRLAKTHIYGGNDWYCNYGGNTYDNILMSADRVSECAGDLNIRPHMVIDDGWQLARLNGYNGGPWRYPNSKFGDMEKTANGISDLGAVPGLWYRPLITAEYMPCEYLLENRWDGEVGHLDPSHPDVLKYVASETSVLRGWGYKLLKFDFTCYDIFGQYGFQMGENPENGDVNFYDRTKTTAEIITQLYNVIRDAAGDDVSLIGCNTIGHLGAGIFELQRTGDDTSGKEWERTKKMGVNTLAFRMCQHNRFFACDADCVGITDKVPWKNNRQWLDVLGKSGTPLFVSIAENCFGDMYKSDIKRAFRDNVNASKESKLLRPCDWFESLTPKVWKRGDDKYTYDWDM